MPVWFSTGPKNFQLSPLHLVPSSELLDVLAVAILHLLTKSEFATQEVNVLTEWDKKISRAL